jgi:hypothetical protein
MIKKSESSFRDLLNRQGASALILATLEFLRANEVSKELVLSSIRQYYDVGKSKEGVRHYRKLARAYEEMGMVMSTWFTSPRFLDREYKPIALSAEPGPRSIHALVRASRVSLSGRMAVELMRRSPSICINSLGSLAPVRREFVLQDFTVPRAALVIERYLDTLHRNSAHNKKKSILLLERNCHVPQVNFRTIAPVLRDIKKRGSAYIDSVNGDIEGLRKKRSRLKGSGEMSVHIFAWTRLGKPTRHKRG